MEDKNLQSIYPISWITESPIISEFMKNWYLNSEDHLLVADFASGEYDRVPSFFAKFLPKLLQMNLDYEKRIVVYCTDIHLLRLESLFGKLEEDNLIDNVRVIQAPLESMDKEAVLLEPSVNFIDENPETATWLDDFLIGEKRFPVECFDIGILNTDVVGYLCEYYKEYSNAEKALLAVWKMIRSGGLLLVTMPCQQYKVDNISILEKTGFTFLEGLDITISTGKKIVLDRDIPLDTLSRLGHYTFFTFSKT